MREAIPVSYSVYLAGPMTNRPKFNFPLFFETEEWLVTELDWFVRSPAKKDLELISWEEMALVPGFDVGDLVAYVENSPFTMANAMEWDLPAIMASDGIVLLPEWETSTGARWERTVAEALGREVWLMRKDDADEWYVEKDEVQDRMTQYLRGFVNQGAAKSVA